MIGNLLNVLVGLWLAYSAIFANPAGAMNNVLLAAAAVAIIVFAVWARQTDSLRWQSGTNIVLAAVLLGMAVVRWVIGVAPLVSFWFILLVGIAVAIMAMWSMLYRPEPSSLALRRKHGLGCPLAFRSAAGGATSAVAHTPARTARRRRFHAAPARVKTRR